MGRKELNAFRASVIAEHTKVISAFVDTSDSKFGRITLQAMFEAADKDGNGTLDRREVRDALHALGFTFIEDKQLDKIFSRADENDDLVIDFEEFIKETPKTLRTSLVKLAKAPITLLCLTITSARSAFSSFSPITRFAPTTSGANRPVGAGRRAFFCSSASYCLWLWTPRSMQNVRPSGSTTGSITGGAPTQQPCSLQ